MNTITKTIAKAFGMMMMLTVTNVQAQWTTLKAHIHESDISKLTGQSYQNYKGLDAAAFEIIGSVEAVKDKDQVKFMLRTQSINMVKYYMYSYRPALKLKRCTYGKLEEFDRNGVYYPNEIGEAPFEAAMRTATATFDIEVSFLVKDKKYGKGYRAIRIFKNVKANDVVWADELLETNAPIEDIKLLNNPKPVSFKINDSAIQTAVLDFVAKQNKEAETRCKENETDKKKKDEEAERAEANAKEIAKMKEKLGGTISVTSNSAETDDFWSGGEEKTKTEAAKPISFEGVIGYEREEEWYAVGVTEYSSIRGFKNNLKSADWKIEPMEMQKYGIEYESFVPKSEYQTRENNLNSVFRGKYIVASFGTGSKNYSHCSGYNDYQLQPTQIINRKGKVVMESKLEDGFIVLGNTHFAIKLIGKKYQITNMYYIACSSEVLDIRNGRNILELTNNGVYNNNNSHWSSEGAFFIDFDEAVTYYSRYRVASRRILPSFLETVKQEMTLNNYIGCLGYYAGYDKTTGSKINIIFFKDDGTYLEKKKIPMSEVLSQQNI